MIDKDTELYFELQKELDKLDEAYVAGDPQQTLINMGVDATNLSDKVMIQMYYEVAQRIYQLQTKLLGTITDATYTA